MIFMIKALNCWLLDVFLSFDPRLSPILHLSSGKYNISLELCFIKTLAVGLVMMIWDLAGMVF